MREPAAAARGARATRGVCAVAEKREERASDARTRAADAPICQGTQPQTRARAPAREAAAHPLDFLLHHGLIVTATQELAQATEKGGNRPPHPRQYKILPGFRWVY